MDIEIILQAVPFLDAARFCAAARTENAAYIQKELPSVKVSAEIAWRVSEVCSNLISTDANLSEQLRDLSEQLNNPNLDRTVVSRQIELIRNLLWQHLPELNEIIAAIRAETEQSKEYGLLSILLTESATNIVSAFNRASDAGKFVLADKDSESVLDTAGPGHEAKGQEAATECAELEDEDEPYFDGAFFPVRANEAYLKYELIGFVRKLITENVVAPDTMRKLSTLMLGLERLPKTTSGLSVDLSIVEREGGDTSYYDLELSEERIALSSGGHVYTPEVGGDSFSSTLFECESSGFRDGSIDAWDLGSWLLSALELLNVGGQIEVHDESESLEWAIEFERDPFDELEERISRWNAYLEDE